MSSEPKERPILFNAEMVRAVLAGRKTQTRRVVKPQPERWPAKGPDVWATGRGGGSWTTNERKEVVTDSRTGQSTEREYLLGLREWIAEFPCPYGVPGDRLWVREACGAGESDQGHPGVWYPATGDWKWDLPDDADWDRLWKYGGQDDRGRTVPSIHMPRWASRILLEVTDVRVERVQEISAADVVAEGLRTIRHGHPLTAFSELWNSTTKPGQQWADNPWVWAVTFKVLEGGADHA